MTKHRGIAFSALVALNFKAIYEPVAFCLGLHVVLVSLKRLLYLRYGLLGAPDNEAKFTRMFLVVKYSLLFMISACTRGIWLGRLLVTALISVISAVRTIELNRYGKLIQTSLNGFMWPRMKTQVNAPVRNMKLLNLIEHL
jgi:hypothetical protein